MEFVKYHKLKLDTKSVRKTKAGNVVPAIASLLNWIILLCLLLLSTLWNKAYRSRTLRIRISFNISDHANYLLLFPWLWVGLRLRALGFLLNCKRREDLKIWKAPKIVWSAYLCSNNFTHESLSLICLIVYFNALDVLFRVSTHSKYPKRSLNTSGSHESNILRFLPMIWWFYLQNSFLFFFNPENRGCCGVLFLSCLDKQIPLIFFLEIFWSYLSYRGWLGSHQPGEGRPRQLWLVVRIQLHAVHPVITTNEYYPQLS